MKKDSHNKGRIEFYLYFKPYDSPENIDYSCDPTILHIDFEKKSAEIEYKMPCRFSPPMFYHKKILEPLNKELEEILSEKGYKFNSKYLDKDFNFIKIDDDTFIKAHEKNVKKYEGIVDKVKIVLEEFYKKINLKKDFHAYFHDIEELEDDGKLKYAGMHIDADEICFDTKDMSFKLDNPEYLEKAILPIAEEYGFIKKE